ncbi:MAG: glycosyltransferase family 4 protein [Bacteroidales bacterium]|nr:glycosyltransferase family 4 protein [Bacteroidales bacterium]
MKIGIEGQRLFRKNKHGMDVVALELIKNLQVLDRENEYVVFVRPDEDNTCIPQAPNFRIVELGGGTYPLWEQLALPRAVKKEGCDLLHCTSNTAPLLNGVPTILTLHDIIYLEKLSLFQKAGSWYQRIGNTYRRLVVPAVVKKAAKLVTVSHYERANIEQYFGPMDKLSVIHNGVGEHFRKIEDTKLLEAVREKYKLPRKFLFCLGNTDPKKNTPNMLKAFALFRLETGQKNKGQNQNQNQGDSKSQNQSENYKLVLPDYEESQLMQVLRDIGHTEIREDIVMTGYVPNSDMPALLNLCELFLYPSLRESFGLPILEAMACGLPVITSNTSSMPEVAGEAALLVDPDEPAAIAGAIGRVLDEEALNARLRAMGPERAAGFSWRGMAEQYLQLYRALFRESAKQ